MTKPRDRRSSKPNWFSAYGQYVLLIVVAVITIFLVVFALSRPASVSPSSIQKIPTNGATPGQTATPAPKPTVIRTPTPTAAFLGDSYTVGEGATAPQKRWTSQLSGANGWREVNAGSSGAGYGTPGATSSARPYVDLVEDVVAADPDIVFVSGGRFDYSGESSVATVSSAISATFTGLRKGLPDARIIGIGVLWDSSNPPKRVSEITAQVKTAVESIGGTFLDIGQPLAGRDDLVAENGIAPNDDGHALLFQTVDAAVRQIVTAAVPNEVSAQR